MITSQRTIPMPLRVPSIVFIRRFNYSHHPRIGYRYEPAEPLEVRIILHDHYRITYLLKDDGNIEILGVFHGALDIERYLL